MEVTARLAGPDDIAELLRLYALLEGEMADLSYLWTDADGLRAPLDDAFMALIDDPDVVVLIGTIDGLPFGFMIARTEELGDGSLIGAIRFVFTQEEARAVGIGSAMRERVIEHFGRLGIDRLDAHVLPGHRLAKNFFEAGGFSARHIVMHRRPTTDDRE